MSNGNSLSSSSPARSTTAIAAAASSLSVDDYQFPTDHVSIQDHKDEALVVLKSDLMAALNKEAKSLDEDSWMFDSPRSRIHLISRPGGVLHKRFENTKHHQLAPQK